MRESSRFLKVLPFISLPVLMALLVGVWELLVRIAGISPYTLPPPAKVGDELATLLTGSAI